MDQLVQSHWNISESTSLVQVSDIRHSKFSPIEKGADNPKVKKFKRIPKSSINGPTNICDTNGLSECLHRACPSARLVFFGYDESGSYIYCVRGILALLCPQSQPFSQVYRKTPSQEVWRVICLGFKFQVAMPCWCWKQNQI